MERDLFCQCCQMTMAYDLNFQNLYNENGNENDVFLIITNSTIINLLLKDIVVNDNINYAMMNTGATCIEINNNNDMILHYVNRIDHVLLTLDARL